MGEFNTYLFEYEHEGSTWVLEVKASSREDAEARLAKRRTYLGELKVRIGASWLDRWVRLFKRSEA